MPKLPSRAIRDIEMNDLLEFMRTHKIRNREMCERVGITKQTLYNWLYHGGKPNRRNQLAIRKAVEQIVKEGK